MSDAQPPYDQRLANQAAAADQCMKLGGVLLDPGKRKTGFTDSPQQPSHPAQLGHVGGADTGEPY